MYLKRIAIRNFRRLTDVEVDFDERETVFVGPNNSGKTSATAIIRSFLSNRDFKVHDFSICAMSSINSFDQDNQLPLPSIQLDIWFQIDPNSIGFGKVFALVTNLSGDFTEIGMRCSLEVEDALELWENYSQANPIRDDGSRKIKLIDFLGFGNNLKTHFKTHYYSLERCENGIIDTPLDPNEGKNTLRSLLRVDFVDAQRNIDDENTPRSNRLSQAFAAYYQRNLEKASVSEDAVMVIESNNKNLTAHYEKLFEPLMGVISGLGLPSQNDRVMKVVSTLSSEVALRGSTELFYIDEISSHELPESYNGLGFKNLVFMAIQIDNYYKQWLSTEKNRPLCQMIIVEEPEVHLHAQVQQTFIRNMWNVLAQDAEGGTHRPQLTITTHSSHILDTVDFSKIRYFRRLEVSDENYRTKHQCSTIHNLKTFNPESMDVEGRKITGKEVLDFLKKYIRLTHCDLFFADAAILVEGAVEKLLLPKMIDICAKSLNSKYLTILEVGGAYAMRFAGLFDFLKIPYLVITDVDSVNPLDKGKNCRASDNGAVTSNASLKYYFKGVELISDLNQKNEREQAQSNNMRFITYQKKIRTDFFGTEYEFHGRTLEETFVYENYSLFKSNNLSIGVSLPDSADDFHTAVWERIKNSTFKKTEFAMDILAYEEDAGSTTSWIVPQYIVAGLRWLEQRIAYHKLAGDQND